MLSATLEDSAGLDIGETRKILPYGAKARAFARRPPEQDAVINILSGSVRSGKTWATIPKILWASRYGVSGRKILTGVSKQTIYQNVLLDLFEVLGSDCRYNRQSGELAILETQWLAIGASDEGAEKKIRGLTVGVAVCDELTKMPESFFKMLISRMSPKGARAYASTNPDNPAHWVNTELLENHKLTRGLAGADLWAETFTMDDNPTLTEEYKERLKRQYTGVWYKRFVLGMWVAASGSIYGDVLTDDLYYDDSTRPIGLLHRNGHVGRFVGLDVGTVNAFAALDIYDDGKTLWVERELYWDSRKEGTQKTNSEYALMIDRFFQDSDPYDIPPIIIDPSAASFKAELNARGYLVIDAVNEVLEGIRKVSALMGQKRIRIHTRCVNLIRELASYAWDDKAAARGVEQPIKMNDHGVDAIRYGIATKWSDWRIAA